MHLRFPVYLDMIPLAGHHLVPLGGYERERLGVGVNSELASALNALRVMDDPPRVVGIATKWMESKTLGVDDAEHLGRCVGRLGLAFRGGILPSVKLVPPNSDEGVAAAYLGMLILEETDPVDHSKPSRLSRCKQCGNFILQHPQGRRADYCSKRCKNRHLRG